jgi:hypothetical protein
MMSNLIPQYFKQFCKKAALAAAMVGIVSGAVATAEPPPGRTLKVVLAPRSTADPFEVTKHFAQSCPNVLITRNEHESDFMVVAGGWSGDYRFMVVRKGGDVLYITETALLSNSVKNVCKYLNTRA